MLFALDDAGTGDQDELRRVLKIAELNAHSGRLYRRFRQQRRFLRGDPMRAEPARGPDERTEQRMRFERLRFELGVKLAAEIPGMILDLADLDVGAVGRLARDLETVRGQHFLEFAIEFEAMAMALADVRWQP